MTQHAPNSDQDPNPAERLVLGSPILTRIKYCEEVFRKPARKRTRNRSRMPESPLFIPKKNKSLTRLESGHSSMESQHSEPYRSAAPKPYKDPYENVVITPYTCGNHGDHGNHPTTPYYKYTPKQYPDHYENVDHVVYHQQSYLSYYPHNQYVKYVPQRSVPPVPPYSQQDGYGPARPARTCRQYGPRPDHMCWKSPVFDTTTSGYSSYDKTLSLNRGPPSSMTLPTMCEENGRIPGSVVPTFNRNHQKIIMDNTLLRQYFCVALSACIMCPPCGYWSLYQAFKVDDMVDSGNYLGAERLARKIKRYSIVMFCVGVFWVSLAVGIFVFVLNKL